MEEDYPGWLGVSNPRFVGEEIAYKRTTAEKATEFMGKENTTELVRGGRFEEVIHLLEVVGKDNNLLFRSVPSAGDLGILYQEALDREAFSKAILDLLHGEGDVANRLGAYARFVEDRGLPDKWTFRTCFLFFVHPESELFIKPENIRGFLKLAESGVVLGSKPSGEVYRQIRGLAGKALEELEEYGLHDMIDVQSVIWRCARVARERARRLVTPKRRDEFAALFEEFFFDRPESVTDFRWEEIRNMILGGA